MGEHTFICTSDYRGNILGSDKVHHFRRGEEYGSLGQYIALNDNTPICLPGSDMGQKHFCVNDDGNGYLRGMLIHAIAFAPRERRCGGGTFRFSEAEQETLRREWAFYIKPDSGAINFNQNFFMAKIEPLVHMADSVHIRLE